MSFRPEDEVRSGEIRIKNPIFVFRKIKTDHFAAALSATLRYYVSNSFYCGFDARFVGLNSSVGKQDRFMYNPEFGICVGIVL
ncbi:MAG: hypothetical protein IAB75_03530 [Bacteroidetes bacterium]|uniref:Uncharacterized protein n=1 Tax=Candidatus Cryptobacteroides avicola TaxID=2840757 RepID=A0A940DR18_9BACT|nr:hypothetical protein [Candidatus Cryptobacteroides avicola]